MSARPGARFSRQPAASGLSQRLGDVSYYGEALERLHKKCALESPQALYQLQPEGYRLAEALLDKPAFCRALARDVAGGAYRFSPARQKQVLLDGKPRTLYRFSLTDRIVHGAVERMLAGECARVMPPQLYSYIPGRSRRQALGDFARFIRRHRRRHPDPRQRGLYVLRCDVRAYGESIPTGADSWLWPQLETVYRRAFGVAISERERQLLRQLITPIVEGAGNAGDRPERGVPDGSPLAPLLLNLYLLSLDEAMGGVEGGFYARFGDDMLFAHDNRETFDAAVCRLQQILAQLGLEPNADKCQHLYFNGAGRPGGGYRGNTRVEFLGMQVDFRGRIGLKTQKMRRLRKDIRALVSRASPLLSGLSQDERGAALCRLVNHFWRGDAGRAHPHVVALLQLADDRSQLRQMDYWLARLMIRTLTHRRHASGQRAVSYRMLRERWRLESLEYARNR